MCELTCVVVPPPRRGKGQIIHPQTGWTNQCQIQYKLPGPQHRGAIPPEFTGYALVDFNWRLGIHIVQCGQVQRRGHDAHCRSWSGTSRCLCFCQLCHKLKYYFSRESSASVAIWLFASTGPCAIKRKLPVTFFLILREIIWLVVISAEHLGCLQS